MRIGGFLIGMTAGLIAVSGAHAADAVEVVAEPEPMEYVRVCDAYGTGYFYIPGTETCLRIGGYVRYDIGAGNGPYGGHTVVDHLDGGSNDTYHKEGRLSLQTWTGTETELGTLSTFTETRFNYADGGGSEVTLNFAWIQLGGFRVGKDESAYSTFPNYAAGVIADDIIGYGPFDTNLISYTFDAGNGFSAILSLEEGNSDSFGHDYTLDSYVPHVVAGVKYAGDWGAATLVGGYDSIHEEFAVKGRLDVNVNEQFSLFVMAGYGTSDDDNIDPLENNANFYKPWLGDWAVWAGGAYKFSDKATLNFQGSYTDGGFADGDFALVANVDYQIVKDFHIIPELTYSDLNVEEGTQGPINPGDGFGGMLRFQRDF